MLREHRVCKWLRAFLLIAALPLLGAPSVQAQGAVPPGFAWCGGVTHPADLPAIRQAGFDAVRLDIPWGGPQSWEGMDQVVAAAEAQGLRVLLALHMASPPRGVGPVDPDRPEYIAALKSWVTRVVEHFQASGAVFGWMGPDEPEAALQVTDAGFRAFLTSRYGSLAGVNQAWGTRYTSLNDISGYGVTLSSRMHPLGFSRADADLALYRQYAFLRIMRLWAATIRDLDPTRPLLTGGMARYRSLASVPEAYDAAVVRMVPTGPGPSVPSTDAVAVARRGGRMVAIAALPAWDVPGGFAGAIMHGATGVALEDWRALRQNAQARAVLAAALAAWRRSGCFNRLPRPTVGILYEPFADNAQSPAPLYTGFHSGSNTANLESLFTHFRNGTAYGQLGYLTRDDLTRDRLAGYQVLLLPSVLSLSQSEFGALRGFVEAGGVIVADVGLGSYEAGGLATSIAAELAEFLGIHGLVPPQLRGGPLKVYEKVPLFPSLREGHASSMVGGVQPFAEPSPLMQPRDGSIAFAASVDRTGPKLRLYGGLVVRPVGKGWVVFASMRLWQAWSPADPMFQLFHQNLFSRNPLLTLQNAAFLGDEVRAALFEQGMAALNTGGRARLVTLDVRGDNLYAGPCINLIGPANTEGLRVQAGLAASALGLYERAPITCTLTRGGAMVAVEEYGPKGVKVVVGGGRPRVSLTPEGNAVMKHSFVQKARLTIRDGRYALRPGSVHLLRTKDLETGAVQEMRLQVGPDARIVLEKEFLCDVITLTPDQSPVAPGAKPDGKGAVTP